MCARKPSFDVRASDSGMPSAPRLRRQLGSCRSTIRLRQVLRAGCGTGETDRSEAGIREEQSVMQGPWLPMSRGMSTRRCSRRNESLTGLGYRSCDHREGWQPDSCQVTRGGYSAGGRGDATPHPWHLKGMVRPPWMYCRLSANDFQLGFLAHPAIRVSPRRDPGSRGSS